MTPGNNTLVKNYDAEGVISPFRIVKFGAADYGVLQASAGADLVFGVSNILGAEASGDRVDVVVAGIAKVELGGNVTRGQKLMADANGKAITATTTKEVIGIAAVSGVSGDIGLVLIAPSTLP